MNPEFKKLNEMIDDKIKYELNRNYNYFCVIGIGLIKTEKSKEVFK
jgi:hypothetical protein